VTFSVLSYGASAVAYALATMLLALSRQQVKGAHWVLAAVAGSALWGAAICVLLLSADAGDARPLGTLVPDSLRTLLWTWCLLAALPGKAHWQSPRWWLTAGALALSALAIGVPWGTGNPNDANLAMLVLTIVGCLAAEQIFRNAGPEEKGALKPFIWTIAGIMIYDVFLFSDAVLFSALDERLWEPRGLIAALAVPLFVIAAKRHPDWARTLFISRQVVFYSATLTGIGLYLVSMAIGGFVIREIGGQWGGVIQAAYLLAALGVLAMTLQSARLKARLRVFISKHFFRNRYDYREEWLRLTRTLSDTNQTLPLEQRAVKALCDIVEGRGGQLWLDRSGRALYEPFGAWQAPFPDDELTQESPLVRFLRETQWVIDTRQYGRDPEHYQHALREMADKIPANSLIFPLIHQNDALGIVRLECAAGFRDLNYEDHDLLKTAGRQVAAFLAHDLAREQLTETRQFEAYNKLAAFVMHDLKNVLAQQALLVNNAKKHRDRPEFFDDVIRTVDNGVQRMRRLMRSLESGSLVAPVQRIELNKLLLRAISACSDLSKTPCTFTEEATLWVRANGEQLTSVLTHVIQNAQDAAGASGTVAIRLSAEGDHARVSIRDNGPGMTEEFIRRRLFKPFETTKGASGMGVGAYQAREIVRSLGGDLTAVSEVGVGTEIIISLPCERASRRGRGAGEETVRAPVA
jgi:putative PEP-CTERM system histidine kinase